MNGLQWASCDVTRERRQPTELGGSTEATAWGVEHEGSASVYRASTEQPGTVGCQHHGNGCATRLYGNCSDAMGTQAGEVWQSWHAHVSAAMQENYWKHLISTKNNKLRLPMSTFKMLPRDPTTHVFLLAGVEGRTIFCFLLSVKCRFHFNV